MQNPCGPMRIPHWTTETQISPIEIFSVWTALQILRGANPPFSCLSQNQREFHVEKVTSLLFLHTTHYKSAAEKNLCGNPLPVPRQKQQYEHTLEGWVHKTDFDAKLAMSPVQKFRILFIWVGNSRCSSHSCRFFPTLKNPRKKKSDAESARIPHQTVETDWKGANPAPKQSGKSRLFRIRTLWLSKGGGKYRKKLPHSEG